MGNHRFKLSDMMPNAWFYKLKEIGSRRRRPTRRTNPNSLSKKLPPPPPPSSSANSTRFSYPRKSYYFTREFTPTSNFPRKTNSSSQTKLNNKKSSSSSVSAGCSCRASTPLTNKSSSDSPPPPPDYSASSSSYSSAEDSFRSDRILPTESFDKMVGWSSSDKIGGESNADADDIIINVDSKSLARNFDKLDLSDLDLPPIITKPVVQFDVKVEEMKKMKKKEAVEKPKYRKSSAGYNKQINANSNSNRRHVNSPGLRLRVNSPRIGSRRTGGGGGRKSLSSSSSSSSRRSLSDSLAIVKASFDPQRDFRESMVEMIVENNIKASKDLEDLLACYLSLNSDEYHDLIIKVFKQIWFDLCETPAKE